MARKTMRRAGAWIGLGAFTAGAGAVVGFGIWLLLDVAYWLLDLVWKNGVDALGIAWLPVVVCAVGGVCIGLWNKRFHCAPKPFNEVISDVKRTGRLPSGARRPLGRGVFAAHRLRRFGGARGRPHGTHRRPAALGWASGCAPWACAWA